MAEIASNLQIHLEHVRSFTRQQAIPIRPLTLLVGENSTGKTTFLSTMASVLGEDFPVRPGFNDPPYHLGAFDTIATYKGGRYGRDLSFSMGFSSGAKTNSKPHRVLATYIEDHGAAVLSKLSAERSGYKYYFEFSKRKFAGKIEPPRNQATIDFEAELPLNADTVSPASFAMVAWVKIRDLGDAKIARDPVGFVQTFQSTFPSCHSVAPIRTKPRRTYDELREEYAPEGDHIPYLLARILGEKPRSREGQRLFEAIVDFGSESGLFKHIDIKKLGKRVSEPFQVNVNLGGPPVNLVDVGYGVSQVLPVVVQSVLESPDKVLLMQQPEVHLHPRAQAALGTFFAKLVRHHSRMFLLETHSDYLLDRIRQEVARGRVSADKVLILFFHKPALETTVYPLTLDEYGNVHDAPPEYRSFFMEEEISLLTRVGQ